MGKTKILVGGAGGSAGTNFIQSLRLAKEDFYIVGNDSSKYYAKLSKADKTYVLPLCNSLNYIPALIELIDKEKIDIVHAQPDPEVKVISDNRDLIPAKIFLPSKEAINIAQDKYLFVKKMESECVSVPKTVRFKTPSGLKVYLEHAEGKSWLRASKGAGSLAALPVTNYEQAYMWIEYWRTKGLEWEDFIISEFLPGKEYAFQSLWKDGKLITSAARERIEYLFQARMPSGQSSTPTIAKSVHNELVNFHAMRAVKALDENATGVFCVDLKEDKHGVPNVTEINAGRFFTTSLFFSKAGCNMPYYYIKLALGEDLGSEFLPPFNAVGEDLYWIRQIDCRQVLIHEREL